MNEHIINEALLKKDIEFLRLYSDEEKNIIGNITIYVNKFLNCYKSINDYNLKKKLYNIYSNTPIILKNRKKYCEVLENTIKIYESTSNQIVESANRYGGDANG